jgi:mannitol-1-phosphate 5-dehydrogenase
MADPLIVIFGAGKIGRSFIGQLFGRAGYELLFVDISDPLVRELNRRKGYPVIIKSPDHEERLDIGRVSALHTGDLQGVTDAITRADIMAVCVGKTALDSTAPLIAGGLLEREKKDPGRTLDIILAENMRDAAPYFRERLRRSLPPSFPLDHRVGLVETSIGKMVPIMTARDLDEDPLRVFAESYNTLILDKKGFVGTIPPVEGLSLKAHMKAWVDRKAFIHNLGHATAAYKGYFDHPEAVYMYEVLADPEVLRFTGEVMVQSAEILLEVYPEEFSRKDLSAHIDDLLARFRNRNLGDTVFRVGHDLYRKLGKDDRFMGIIRLALKTGKPFARILEAMTLALFFRAGDESNREFPGDIEFNEAFKKDPDALLESICGRGVVKETDLPAAVMRIYGRLIKEKKSTML